MSRIYLEYYVEYQYKNGAWSHFLCADYELRKKSIVFYCYDSFGCFSPEDIRLENVKALAIKTIGEMNTVYNYTSE